MIELPRNWVWTDLEGVALRQKNAIVDGPFGSNLKLGDYVEEGIPVLQGKNITNDAFKWFDVRFVSEKKAQELKRSSVRVGDILIVKIGSIGYSAILDDLNGHDFAIIPANLAKITHDPDTIDIRYLHRWLTSETAKRYLNKNASKTAQPALSLTKLKKLPVPLPPLEEQRRIAEVLDKADALRQKRRLALQKLDTLLQSVFLKMFGDPVKNSKGFERCSLGDVIHSAKDGPHVSPEYVEDGIPFLSTRNIRHGRVDWNDLKYISPDDAKYHWKKCKPERGDILYTKGGTTGIAKVVDFDREVAVWVHVALLKTNHQVVDPIWLENMLNSSYCYAQSQRFTHGIANRDLGLKRMTKIDMYLPPIEEQRKFSHFVSELRQLELRLTLGESRTKELFTSIQTRAFGGKLFVSSMPSRSDNSVAEISV